MPKSIQSQSITLTAAKLRELGLRVDQEQAVVILGSKLGIVVSPRSSPLCGELYVMGQFHTLPGIAAALSALIQREQLEHPAITRQAFVMDEVAERLRELQPDETVAELARTAGEVASSLALVRDPNKRRAFALAGQAATAIPGFRHQTQAAQAAGAASQALKEREDAIMSILKVSRQLAKEVRGWIEAYTRSANEQAALLETSHLLDAQVARRQFFSMMAGRLNLKSWGYAWHLNVVMMDRGYELNDPGYANRLRECLVFEGSVFWITSILNRLTLDSYASIANQQQQLLTRLDRRIRLLAGFEPLDPYAMLIEFLRTELRAAYRCLAASQKAGDILMKESREHAKAAAHRLRYREPNNFHWYAQS